MTRADWILRPILWFATASIINLLLLRSAHAPVAGLIAGGVLLLAYWRLSTSVAGLPLLYLSTIGIAMFFEHLVSTSVASAASAAFSLACMAASAAILFWQGRELQRWIPRPSGRVFGVIAVAVLPVVLGTTLVILVNLPAPGGWSFVLARATEAAFGIFAVIGAATGPRQPNGGRSFRLWWTDGTIALAAMLVVRLMMRGNPMAP